MTSLRKLFFCRKGAAAVEFAIIAPLFLMTVLSLIGYGIYIAAANSVQQIAADAARTAVAGLSAQERSRLAQAFVNDTTLHYAFLSRDRLQVSVQDDPGNPNQFTVALDYDASDLPIFKLYSFALPDERIRRFSTIRIGGI